MMRVKTTNMLEHAIDRKYARKVYYLFSSYFFIEIKYFNAYYDFSSRLMRAFLFEIEAIGVASSGYVYSIEWR